MFPQVKKPGSIRERTTRPVDVFILDAFTRNQSPSGHPYPLQATATNGYKGHLYVSTSIGVVGVLQL